MDIVIMNADQQVIKSAWKDIIDMTLTGAWSMALGKTIEVTNKKGDVSTKKVYDIIIKHGQVSGEPVVGNLCYVKLARGGGELHLLVACEKVDMKDGFQVSYWIGAKVFANS